ncbi:MAG: hypothetical protein EGR97_04925 [Clostridiales bacterium]|nr:hypothetical protein [Clostridiales bacterium]
MKGRRKTLVIVAAVIASLCLTTGAVYLNSELAVENEQEVQKMEQETNQATKDLLRDADTSRLEHASVVPDTSVQDYINALFENGESQTEADLQALLDIVKFWEDTNNEISIVGSIYEQRPLAEVLAKMSTNRPWIESAYNDITGRDDILSVEDVKAYLEAGLTYEDIISASRLSLRGDISTSQALDQVNEGTSWYSLITGASPLSAELEDVPASELLDARNVAEARSIELNVVLERMQAGEPLGTLDNAEPETPEEISESAAETEEIEKVEDAKDIETAESTAELAVQPESTEALTPADEIERGEAE